MNRTEPRLPPLQSFVYFESAARHLNFTAAAEELGTTQPAVSHRIRAMEADLGVPLFVREHRGVRLTGEGEQLFATVRDSLRALHATTRQVRESAGRRPVTLSTDFGFAKLWLLPRIHALRAAIPDLQLRVVTSQEDADAARREIDLSIHFATRRPEGQAELLFPELVVPVCSPALLTAHGGPFRDAAALCAAPILHLQAREPGRWMNWSEWFAARGLPDAAPPSSLSFNDYSMVIQAAVAGHGVALGWAPLVDDLVARGELAVAHAEPLLTPRGCFLVASGGGPLAGALADLRDWIVAACRGPSVLERSAFAAG
ncbi:LysR family transcriptional regulator [Derxia gummosa]|uniref:LysR family transcriptional regulator n=1 Tax=Derxia gummosa DSM 723 TaxID=1121388 RepID=A0A8B6X8K5_9BURK|nr:LysR family transcriptional regulator [Derxia gummosa]